MMNDKQREQTQISKRTWGKKDNEKHLKCWTVWLKSLPNVKLWRLSGWNLCQMSSFEDCLVNHWFDFSNWVPRLILLMLFFTKHRGERMEKGCEQTLKHKRLYSIWVTTLQNIMDKVTQKVWDTIHGKWMRWIHNICRKQTRWREKFFWWKIYENELGDNIPHTLCIPQPQPFYNFFPPPEIAGLMIRGLLY